MSPRDYMRSGGTHRYCGKPVRFGFAWRDALTVLCPEHLSENDVADDAEVVRGSDRCTKIVQVEGELWTR